MILLDTDHVSVILDPRHARRTPLLARLDAAGERLRLPIIVVEETLRGWLAEINRQRDLHRQIVPYERLQTAVAGFHDWNILAWDATSADHFKTLRTRGVRIGTQDLKIASIALANDALLLSVNLVDFKKVPGLRVEDWLYATSDDN